MENVKAMVRDPEFQALPWNERHNLLAMKDSEYAALSKKDQADVMNSLKTRDFWKPVAAAVVTGNPDASPAETERLRREFVAREGTIGTRVKEGVKVAAKAAAPYLRPVLEGGGAAVGGIVGAGGGTLAGLGASVPTGGTAAPVTVPYGAIAGGVAGSATGYASGKFLADLMEGSPQGAAQTLRDLATGATYEMGGQLTGAAIRNAPAVLSAIKSPVQTRAANQARRTLSTMGDLTPQEASNAVKGEALTRRLDVTLTPAQMTGKPAVAAMEQGLATADPTFAATLNAQDAAAKQGALNRIRQAVGKSRPLPATQDLQTTGTNVLDTMQTARDKAKQIHEDLYDSIPNTQMSVDKIRNAVNLLKSEFRAGDEQVYPGRVISKIEEIIKPPNAPAPPKIDPVTARLTGAQPPQPAQLPASAGFQDLHSLRKDITRQIQDASTGLQPNRELAAKLRVLRTAIDETIEQGMGANNQYVQAKEAFQAFSNTFRSGPVNQVLSRGNEHGGLRLAEEAIPRKLFTPSGADGLIRSIGLGAAKEQMRPFMVADMLKAAAPNGVDYNVQAGINYIQKNRPVLEKLGLVNDARQILKDQIPAELERLLSKRAPDQVTGAQFFTAQDMRGILQKYGNPIKQLYGADALQALRDYNQLMSMIERKNLIPRGSGSNTADKAMNVANLMLKESTGPARALTDGLLGAIAQGAGIGTGASLASGNFSTPAALLGGAVMAGREMLKNHNSQVAKAFVKILQDATLNPQVAKGLMKLQRTGEVPATLRAVIDKHLIGATAAAVDDRDGK